MAKKNRKMGYSLQCCLFLEFDMFCVNELSLELSVEQVGGLADTVSGWDGKKKGTGKEEFAVWQWQTINKTCYVRLQPIFLLFFNGGAAVGSQVPSIGEKIRFD